jgi:glycosyltransferase involved in cell wall biosynthesis
LLATVVTVVFNDLPGLVKTMGSVLQHLGDDAEYWIIDGSTTEDVRRHLSTVTHPSVRWLSERDEGLYDAMNKGLDRAAGDYVIFMNAGDLFDPAFDLEGFIASDPERAQVLVGYSIERFGGDSYLRPGVGREAMAFTSPAHQATFYPRAFYATNRYELARRIGADTLYTWQAMASCGAIFVPRVVCSFTLGGLSSSYSWRSTRLRMKESRGALDLVRLFAKFLLWRLLPRKHFYRTLAFSKYTRLNGRNLRPLTDRRLVRVKD